MPVRSKLLSCQGQERSDDRPEEGRREEGERERERERERMNISGNLENLSLHGLYHEDSLALK
jgi:hypothetical protein